MMIMWTIERVKNELEKLCAADHLVLDVPVEINGRLTRAMGRVKYNERSDGFMLPTKIEFARNLLQGASDEDILQVIKHEYVHFYLITNEPYEKHGHDVMFKAKCEEIGCTHSNSSQRVEGFAKEQTKYEVWCEDCEECIGTYSRMCKTLKEIKYCTCGRCGSDKLAVIQNW